MVLFGEFLHHGNNFGALQLGTIGHVKEGIALLNGGALAGLLQDLLRFHDDFEINCIGSD